MGLADYEVFIRERLRVWDETLDLSEGSPIDTQVIQPLLRRLGTDPFTVDASTFIIERLTQEFPDLATTDGDAVSDLLVKPALLLWDPIIREIQRVKNMLSFRDPATLTLDEAEALGANLFAYRDRGNFARGTVRIYYAQALNASITQANFVTSRSGLHFFPDGAQSIRLEEMLLNTEGELYYFDINVVAERPGDEYNIGPNEIVTIANVPAAVRVVNKNRFRFGLPEEDSVAFANRIQNDLSERSLVTLRGINAKLNKAFPEVTRLAVIGFNDPEMQRDVITGGALGPIIAAGSNASSVPDGEFKPFSRRVTIPTGANFLTNVGPVGKSSGYVLTLFDMFGANPPTVRDLEITRVINDQTVEVAEQVLAPAQNKTWCLRRIELTLSDIPGGIVFPEGVNGEVRVEPNKVHIGGCTDILIRGADFDTGTTVIYAISDEDPLLQGTKLDLTPGAGFVDVEDFTLGSNYQVGDAVYEAFRLAALEQYTFEILDGVASGVYRVLGVSQQAGQPPRLQIDPVPLNPAGFFRWRLLDDIEIDLVEPKETRVEGTTGQVIQDQDLFSTSPPIDFDELGVSVGDILRISNGSVAGDYTVLEVPAPLFTKVRVDRTFTATQTGLKFSIFRRNVGGGVKRPLVRITRIDLLDSTSQPVGTSIPYAKPVEIRSRAFQNPGTGEKVATTTASLGIVSLPEPSGGYNFGSGGTISFTWDGGPTITTTFPAGTTSVSTARNLFNAASQSAVQQDICQIITYNGQHYLGFIPIGPNMRTTAPSTVHAVLFGDNTVRTTRDIRTPDVSDWNAVTPTIDFDLDVVWVRDGFQTGFYSDLERGYASSSLGASTALRVSHDFAPEIFRSVRVGARSLGSARLYFLEPTSIEVDQKSRFRVEKEDGTELFFKPDPTLRFQRIPAPPNGKKPKNGVTTLSGNTLQSNGIDFVKKGIRVGDILEIDFVPITGSQSLADPVPSLALRDLRISIDNQPDKVITFINDVATPGAVSREGVAKQINNLVGLNIASIVEVTPGDFRLQFNPEILLIIRPQPGSTTQANTILGFSNSAITNNLSANAGEYRISAVAPGGAVDKLQVTTMSGAAVSFSAASNQQFKVFRRGGQRIISTQMARNVAEAGLYYFDVELVSEGVGDLWNIDADVPMSAEGYKSDGYYLSTPDTNLSFSPAEKIVLHLSRSILEVGVDDDLENSTQLTGQSISINYEYSSIVDNVQSFVSADTERVINQSPLTRHLVPHFVRFDLFYSGGSKETEILPDIQRYIRELNPDEAIESSDLQRIVLNRGATSIQNPIDMLAVVHNYDRSITLARSQNALTTGRIAAFVPDRITLTRRAV